MKAMAIDVSSGNDPCEWRTQHPGSPQRELAPGRNPTWNFEFLTFTTSLARPSGQKWYQ